MTKEEGKQQIQNPIRKFESMPDYARKTCNEEQTKKNLIEPLFDALGWDTRSDEVQAEQNVSGGRADYAFKINGVTQFYVEAKKLGTDLENKEYQNQLIEYAYNKDVAWGILTNFEKLFIFNALEKDPKPIKFDFKEYTKDFDLLWLISRESFYSGEINEWAERLGIKSIPVPPVGKQLAKDLTEWRDILEKFISKYAEKSGKILTRNEVDEAVQKFLDRLIFIRAAEDRGLEDKVLLPLYHDFKSGKRGDLTSELNKIFHEFETNYDSTLFSKHFSENLDLKLIEENIVEIIRGMYFTKDGKRYDFSLIDADILGEVYEQYLGTIQVRGGGERKEQGIYYTPKFIVNYIIENTLRMLIYETPLSISEIKNLKILDPACGSGSFLIKTFDFLNKVYEGGKISRTERESTILTSNIHGVDLDPKAVEVTQLNLMLSAAKKRELLPDLRENIKAGNSLISGTKEKLRNYFGDNFGDEKPFEWREEFTNVFKQGGFDVIVGNPPYVNLANIKDAGEREFFKHEYQTAKNKSDLYSFFTEKSISLLKEGGVLGFIFSNSWIGTDSFSKFRKFLIENTTILKLVKLPPAIFSDATVTTVLVFLKKQKAPKNYSIPLFEYRDGSFVKLPHTLEYERIKTSPNFNFSFEEEINFKAPTIKLGDVAKFSLGIKTSDDKRFILDRKKDGDTYKLLRGRDVYRYFYRHTGNWIWYKPELMMEKVGAGPRKLEYFLTDKLLFRSITGGSIISTIDTEKFLTNDKVHVLHDTKGYSMKFILGVVNSSAVGRWIKSTFGDLLEIKINQLEQIPIPKLDFSNQGDEVKHQKISDLVDEMLELHKKIHKTEENSNGWEKLKLEIEKTDRKIDQEAYKLYGLAPE